VADPGHGLAVRQAGDKITRIIHGDRSDHQPVGHQLAWLIALGSHGRQLYVR
jgi:hypothetical protein